jgi:dolichol kinase
MLLTGERHELRNCNGPDRWENFYTFLFLGLIVYFCWDYVVAIMAVTGVYFIWREWKKDDR